jgi:myo-inositol-1(or 4)-monophosphatase
VDGTSNFAIGIPVYSVSLALMIQGEIVVGLVYDPSRDEMFAARQGLGAELNNQPLLAQTPKTALSQCSSIVDFKRLKPTLATRLAVQAPYASQRSFGSVALDWCWIAAGRGQVYLHGAQNIWDYAAGWLILEEAGGKSSTLDQDNVVVPRVEKRSAMAATTPDLFNEWQLFLLT